MNAEIAPGVHVKFAALSTLIAMKETTGRARDEDDIRHMRMILEAGDHDEP
jgi:predicted nucleotidyltransferase